VTKGREAKYRLIAQYVRGDIEGPWHLIAYGNGKAFPPCRFQSVEELLRRMQLALPDRDPVLPATSRERAESHILFSEDVTLDNAQLTILGFL
jgi:hypothetical protein